MSSDEKNMDSIESMASAIMRSAHSGNQHGAMHEIASRKAFMQREEQRDEYHATEMREPGEAE